MKRVFAWMAGMLLLAPNGYAADYLVTLHHKAFSVPNITIAKGDSITFQNMDEKVAYHLYHQSKEHGFEIRSLLPFQEKKKVFLTLGQLDVRCAIHPDMKLVITVE